jgi:mRNA interferase MazF
VNRGDLYRVHKATPRDPRRSRVFVVVSRQVLVDSRFSTVICAPVHSQYDGLSPQVEVGVAEGLKHESAVCCDELMSIPKSRLTDYMGKLSAQKIRDLALALDVAVGLS